MPSSLQENQDLSKKLKHLVCFKAPYPQSLLSPSGVAPSTPPPNPSIPPYFLCSILFILGKKVGGGEPVDVPRCQSPADWEPGADVARRMLQAKTISR